MELLRLFFLVPAGFLLLFGLVVGLFLRRTMRATPELRFDPFWKQRPTFASPSMYHWYLASTISLLLGLLLMVLGMLLGLA